MSNPVQGIPAPVNDAAPQETQTNTSAAPQDPKLEIYARKERALLKMRKEFEDMKRAFETEKSRYVPKAELEANPLNYVDYQKLTETALNQPNINDPTIKALRQELNEIRQQQAQREEQALQREKAQVEQTRKQIDAEVKLLANGNPEFELIEKWDAHEAVRELIEQTFEEQGYLMDTKAAAAAVEENLLSYALKIQGSAKLKPKDPVDAIPGQTAAAPADKPKWQNRNERYSVTSSERNLNTLTNRLAQENPKPASSEQERRARAIAAIKGQLK